MTKHQKKEQLKLSTSESIGGGVEQNEVESRLKSGAFLKET
jgi:hypothetical protein